MFSPLSLNSTSSSNILSIQALHIIITSSFPKECTRAFPMKFYLKYDIANNIVVFYMGFKLSSVFILPVNANTRVNIICNHVCKVVPPNNNKDKVGNLTTKS